MTDPAQVSKAVAREEVEPESHPLVRSLVGLVPAGVPRAPTFRPEIAFRSLRSWAYAAALLNAQQVAAIPLRLYARKRKGMKAAVQTRPISMRRKAWLCGDGAYMPSATVCAKASANIDEMEEVVGPHPLTDLLKRANPYCTGYDLLVGTAVALDSVGDAYWGLAFNSLAMPSQVWPLPPQFVEVIPGTERLIDAYRFGANRAQSIDLEPEEVVHFRGPRLTNVYYGTGKLEAAWNIIQQNAAMHEMDYATFANQARPDYLVSVEGEPSEDDLKAFSEKVRAQLRGTRRTAGFLTVSGKVDVKPLNWVPKDVAGRDRIVEEIAAVYGVPVGLLLTNDPNRANAEAGQHGWRANTILPLCRRVEETLNQDLTPYFGDGDELVVAFDDPVPENVVEKRAAMQVEVSTGIRPINEARRVYLGEQPLPDPMADRPLVNGQPLGSASMISGFGAVSGSGNGRRVEGDADDGTDPAGTADNEQEPAPTDSDGQADQVAQVDEAKAMRRLAEMVDRHNRRHGDTVTLTEAVEVYARAKE